MQRPRDQWIAIAVAAVLDEELFEAAQRVSRDNSQWSPRRAESGHWLLRGLVKCGHCAMSVSCHKMRGRNGAFERDGSVGVEQLDESAGEDAEVVVALGGGDEQGLGRGGGVVEAVGGAVLAGEAFVALEHFDVGGVFDLLAAVEGAPMGGKHGGGVEDAHGVQRGRDDEGATDVTMGDGIVV